jgi:hypothetical protein
MPPFGELITEVADVTGFILVHRKPHFDTILGLKVLRLPIKH